MPSTVCLIDSHNYIHRAYHGLPPMSGPAGLPTHATFGFARTLIKVLKEQRPDYVAALFEGRRSFRRELFSEYKANRVETPDDLKTQFPYARQVAAALGFPCIEADGFEADDVIGTLAVQLREHGLSVVIVSGDKDLAQLIAEDVTLFDVAKDKLFDDQAVRAAFGVRPSQIPDFLALTGDSIDNIPGVPGIGPKTAAAILTELGDVDTVIAEPERLAAVQVRGSAGLRAKIEPATDQLELARRLATIRRDVPLEVEPESLRWNGARRAEIETLFAELGFGRRIRDEIPRWSGEGAAGTPIDRDSESDSHLDQAGSETHAAPAGTSQPPATPETAARRKRRRKTPRAETGRLAL